MNKLNPNDLYEWQQEKAYGEVFEAVQVDDEIDDINYNEGLI